VAAVGCAETLPKADRDLFAAIKRADAGEVQRLLASGADVNRNEAGASPLFAAMERLARAPARRTPTEAEVAKVVDVVELLLANGARVDVRASGGAMPIHMAALTGQTTLVQMLIAKGAGVDVRTTDGVTPLYQAAKKDAAEVAELLIDRGADVNARTKSGYTPLEVAAEHGSAEVATLLLARGADVNATDKEGFSPLLSACRSLLILYTLRAPTPGAETIRRKFSAREVAETRAAVASVKGEFAAVAMLLVNGGAAPNVAAPGFTPLSAAATVGEAALADALMAHGAAIDDISTGESPLHAAIAEGHADVATLIIDRGANVNARNKSQFTPLHFLATYMRDRELAELLIRRGADVSAKDQAGLTPIQLAIRARNDAVAEVLRRHGAR
jgi:ankyrin repeat protein